jgi:hypothetical protein
MQRGLLVLVLVVACGRVEAGCIDPASLSHASVGIERYFEENERDAESGAGIAGTGWFLSPTTMATVEHVATSMKLSHQDWKPLEVRTAGGAHSVPVRLRQILGTDAEKIAVLELQAAVPGAQASALRMEPLRDEEPLVSLAYPHERMRVAGGRFVRYGEGEKFAGTALLEMYDGNDRLVLDHGASGAPVFDCTGHVVAVVSNLFTSTMQFLSQPIRISTAWGDANVASVPVQVLKDYGRAD